MIEGFFTALSGMRTASRNLEVSANNVANLQTPGFKKSRAVITDQRTGGSNISALTRLQTSGALIPTGNALDLAVEGNGFLQVALPGGGTGFTRSARFVVDNSGRLATVDGRPLQPEITVPGNHQGISIRGDGQVSALVNGQPVTLGRIQLAGFNNPGGLAPLGRNVFAQTAQSGQPVAGAPGTGGLGTLRSGALESSNVDLAEESVQQILSKTAFKANANVVRVAEDMTGALLDIKA